MKWLRTMKKRSIWIMIYAVYLALALISVHAFLAQDSVDDIRSKMDEKYEYHLKFENDGATTHYIVDRHIDSAPGNIDLTYWTQDNKLDIQNVQNIRSLEIDVQSMFEDESQNVFKKSHTKIPTMDMDYWLDAGDGIFTIEFNIDKDQQLETLIFTKFPVPKSVKVNNQEWWKTDLNYRVLDEHLEISDIPTGKTTVIIYFKLENKSPTADFTTNPAEYAGVNEDISFDASLSSDPDGDIVSWVWDYGDSTSDSGKTTTHSFSKPGVYTIRLTVRDDAEPFAEDWVEKNITVQYGAEDDFDSDGLRDAWEMEHFNSTSETGSGDYDSDGATNKEELDAGTDPTDRDSKPPEKGGDDEPTDDSGTMMILVVVIIVIVLLVVVMFVLRSKGSKDEQGKPKKEEPAEEVDDEMIAELEAKIKRAKSLGLPTREMERLLKNAKEGKPLEVAPIDEDSSKQTNRGRGRKTDPGKGRSRSSGRGTKRR